MAGAVRSGGPHGVGGTGGSGERAWRWCELQGGEVHGPTPMDVGAAVDARSCVRKLRGKRGLESAVESGTPPPEAC